MGPDLACATVARAEGQQATPDRDGWQGKVGSANSGTFVLSPLDRPPQTLPECAGRLAPHLRIACTYRRQALKSFPYATHFFDFDPFE